MCRAEKCAWRHGLVQGRNYGFTRAHLVARRMRGSLLSPPFRAETACLTEFKYAVDILCVAPADIYFYKLLNLYAAI